MVIQQEEHKTCLGPYRVLDLAEGGCMLCAKILGDLGADVIKIEKPEGSPSRSIGPFFQDIPNREKSLFWFAYNTNKRGITLNIETSDGREIFKKLVRTTDFVIESFTPGYLDELGLGYSELSRINPRLIMTSITPFGQTGPYAKYKGPDLVTWAMSGYMYLCGDPDRAPTWISFPQASFHGSAEGAAASMIAHWHREATGEGQQADISIQESATNLLFIATPYWDLNKFKTPRVGNVGVLNKATSRQGFRCKDGHVTAIILGGGGAAFVSSTRSLIAWMAEEGKAPQWLQDFNWETEYDSMNVSQETVDRVEKYIIEFFESKTKQEILEEGAIKRGIIVAPVYTAEDIYKQPHFAIRDFWVPVEHPELGAAINYCGPFVKMSETPLRIQRRAPRIGEHNEEVYEKELGLTKADLVTLKQAGVI